VGTLPEAAERIVNAALVAEFTVVDSRGRPITHPMIPLYDGEFVFVHSSILFSKKLGHVRANPKVALAITDPVGTPVEPFHRVLIQGDAIVIDDDPHTCWERIMPLWAAKEPAAQEFFKKRVALPLFWERALVQIAPRRVFVWENARTDVAPVVYEPAGVA
jgi:hypothetical protein